MRSCYFTSYDILFYLFVRLTISLLIQARPVVKRSAASGSLPKQAKQDHAKDDDKSGKAVGRTSGFSSADRDVFTYPLGYTT